MSDVATPLLPDLAGGSVWLVGVGPGDPGLLSLLAFRAIRQADVIIHDDDLDPAIRGLLPATAAVEVLVATDAMPSLAVAAAHRAGALAALGWRVVRLVAGDPFGSPSAIEEAQLLLEARIALRVVPGIVATLAGPAYAGIPATQRDVNSLFAMLALREGDEAAVSAAARAVPMLFLSLTLGSVARVVAVLREAGYDPSTPITLITRAGTLRQSVEETTLAAYRRGDEVSSTPAVLVIDRTAARRDAPRARTFEGVRIPAHPLGFSMAGIAG
jgi:uroporphyrin-III C-methyltransferase